MGFDLGNFVQAGINWFGNELQNRRQADAAEQAQAFSAQQYATRYQTTVADMKAAGINPMLAYGSGPGNAPSGVQAQTTNSAQGVNESFNQSRIADATVELMQAQASAAQAEARKKTAETPTSGNLGDANLALLTKQSQQVAEQIVLTSRQASNASQQGHVLTATVDQLEQSAKLMKEQGKTQREIQEQLRAIVAKVNTEVDLNKLDLDAAKFSGNFGRRSQEFRMVEEVLSDMVPNLGRLFQGAKKRKGWSTTERSDNKGNRSMETREWSE